MSNGNEDDGLYDLIDVDDNGSETCRTDDLLFNNNCIDWNRMKVNISQESLTQNRLKNIRNDKNPDADALKLTYNNYYSSELKVSQGLEGLSARSRLINKRAETNMDIYLPNNMRRNNYTNGSDTELSLCRVCMKKNSYGVCWCLFCGALIIGAEKNEQLNYTGIRNNDDSHDESDKGINVMDTTHLCNGTVKWRHMDVEEIDNKGRDRIETIGVKLDLGGLETVRSSNMEDWDFDLEIGEDIPSISNSTTLPLVVVPPLDLSGLDSSRQIRKTPQLNHASLDESKENCDRATRKWASSSTAWVDIPENMLKKKPSTYYRNKLNSCTNKIGITVYRSGMVDDSEYLPQVSRSKNFVKAKEKLAVTNQSPIINSDANYDVTNLVVLDQPPILIGCSHQNDYENSVVSLWQCLPAEIWIKIMSYLSHHHLSRLQKTCRRVYLISLDSSLWRIIPLYRHATLNNDHILYIAKKLPRELHFKNCFGTNITYEGLVDMFKICGDGLKKISFISCSKGAFEDDQFLELSSIYCHNVTHINASYLMNFRDETLTKMIKGFVKIESLNVMGAHSISNTSIKSLIEHHRTSLINLDLYGCFKLNSCTLTLLEECLNLRSLALGSISNLKRAALINMLQKLSQLTILDLRGTMKLVDDSLLDKICQSCPKLQQIILTNSSRLTDDGAIGLAKSCVSNSLKVLDICGCSKITEKGLEEVLKQCHELEDLDISCTGIKGDGAKFFKMYAPPKLRCLRINNNKFISTAELLSLIRSCKKLTTIYMCGTTSIGSWRSIEEQFPHITFKHE